MEKISTEEYFKARLEDQIRWHDEKSRKAQRSYKHLQLIVIVCSALIPLLTGFIGADSFALKVLVGSLGVAAAIATAVVGLNKFQEHWLNYRTTCESLRHEKYLYLTRTSPYDAGDVSSLLVERVEGLISRQNTDWSKFMAEQTGGKNSARK